VPREWVTEFHAAPARRDRELVTWPSAGLLDSAGRHTRQSLLTIGSGAPFDMQRSPKASRFPPISGGWLKVSSCAGRPPRSSPHPDAPASDQALSALAEVRASIDELEAIAGRLARSAVAHGGSWKEVANSLRLPEDQARSYQR